MLFLSSFPFPNVTTGSSIIYVPDDYSTIQEAVDAANPGDTIYVKAGVYYENGITIDKELKLIGENKETTIIDGNFSKGILLIRLCSNVLISNFTIRNSGSGEWYWDPVVGYSIECAGIILAKAKNCTIKNNKIIENYIGIYIIYTNRSRILQNEVINSAIMSIYALFWCWSNSFVNNTIRGDPYSPHGIHLEYCANNTIEGNVVEGCSLGIYAHSRISISFGDIVTGNKVLDNRVGIGYHGICNNRINNNLVANCSHTGISISESSGNIIKMNDLRNNIYNFGVSGQRLEHFQQDIDISNYINGKPIYYLINQTNLMIDSSSFGGVGFLALINCKNITVKGLKLENNRQGILLAYTTNCSIIENTMLNNLYGIALVNSSGNHIYHNNFVDNENGIWNYYSNNSWHNPYPSGGNYWSDYAGFDLYSGPYQNETGRDCIGDTPYTIDENNQDLYPLIYPYPIDPWGDIDDDGIPNYLDRVHFKVMNFTYPNDIFEWNTTWHLIAYFLEPSQSSSQFLLALGELGVSNDREYNTTFGLIFEIENPFNNATEFLNWLEKYHLITVENQSEASNYLSTFLSSDGMFRILLLFKYNSITDWGIDSYIIHNPVPIAAAVITIAIDVSLMIFSWWIRQEKDIEQGQQFNPETTMEMARGTLFSSIYMIISSLASLASIKISAILGVVGIVIGVAEVLSAWQDPLIDLHIYNSTRHHVLGIDYSTGVVQTYFSHGLYSGRTDAMQLVLLSKDYNSYNATLISKALNNTSFFFNIYDLQLNETIKSNGILRPEEVVSTTIYFIANKTFANQLFLTAKVPKVIIKGETMQIEIQLRDENLTSVNGALVEVLINNETNVATNIENGKYIVSIDTNQLDVGRATLTIVASKDGYLGAREDFVIVVSTALRAVEIFILPF